MKSEHLYKFKFEMPNSIGFALFGILKMKKIIMYSCKLFPSFLNEKISLLPGNLLDV